MSTRSSSSMAICARLRRGDGGGVLAAIPAPDDVGAFQAEWHARGYLADAQLDPQDQAQAVVDVITSRAQIDIVWVRPRGTMQLPDS